MIMDEYKSPPKHPIYEHLKNVEDITYNNFEDLVLKEGKDVYLLAIKPSEDLE